MTECGPQSYMVKVYELNPIFWGLQSFGSSPGQSICSLQQLDYRISSQELAIFYHFILICFFSEAANNFLLSYYNQAVSKLSERLSHSINIYNIHGNSTVTERYQCHYQIYFIIQNIISYLPNNNFFQQIRIRE